MTKITAAGLELNRPFGAGLERRSGAELELERTCGAVHAVFFRFVRQIAGRGAHAEAAEKRAEWCVHREMSAGRDGINFKMHPWRQ